MTDDELFRQITSQAEGDDARAPRARPGGRHRRGRRSRIRSGVATRRPGEDQPMTSQSAHSMASVSKAVTGTAIMQLVETGRLDIDRPLVDYLPSFRLADLRYPLITIRHLLAHTSGLPSARPEELSDSPLIWLAGFRERLRLRRHGRNRTCAQPDRHHAAGRAGAILCLRRSELRHPGRRHRERHRRRVRGLLPAAPFSAARHARLYLPGSEISHRLVTADQDEQAAPIIGPASPTAAGARQQMPPHQRYRSARGGPRPRQRRRA